MEQKNYSIVAVNKKRYVVTSITGREISIHANPDFYKTGKALCGVLKDEETLEEWKKRCVKKKKKK